MLVSQAEVSEDKGGVLLVSQARSGANGRSRKRFCGLAVRHGAPRCPPVAGHRTRASLSAQSSRGNRAVSTRAGTGLPRSPRWREHGTQVREAASCRSNSCCGGGRAGAIGGARDGRPTPFRYLPIERGSVTAATIFMRPPQVGHSVTSNWNTLARSTAQASLCRRWAVGRSPSLVGAANASTCSFAESGSIRCSSASARFRRERRSRRRSYRRTARLCSSVPLFSWWDRIKACLLYTSPSPRDRTRSRMPSSA